jgi:hypothetical protein
MRLLILAGRAMASYDHFAQELRGQMKHAAACGAFDMLVCAGDLFRSLPPGNRPELGMGFCCDAMSNELTIGDTVIIPRNNGSGMTVRFLLPRSPPVARRPLFGR